MEVDTVHSTLERPPIYTPVHYIMKMGEARCGIQQKHPYTVHPLDYTFSKAYENLRNNYHSIRPGRHPTDATLAEIRALKYVNGEVFYKTRHTKVRAQLPQ
jgi:hypothetical protein